MWQPSPEDLQRVFDEQNPWQRRGAVPDSLARKVERPLAQLLWRRLRNDDPHLGLTRFDGQLDYDA